MRDAKRHRLYKTRPLFLLDRSNDTLWVFNATRAGWGSGQWCCTKKCTMRGITATNPFNLWPYLDISDCLVPAGIIWDVQFQNGKSEMLRGVHRPWVVCWTSAAAQPAVITETLDHFGWKTPPRSSSPTCDQSPPHFKLLKGSRTQLETCWKPEHLPLPTFSIYKCLFS